MMAAIPLKWKVLRVNLTEKTVKTEELDAVFIRKYLGGRAAGAYFLLKEIPAGADPLGADNRLIFATGVLTYTRLSGANRYSVLAKSPLTGGFGEAEAGGWWGPALVAAGLNIIIIEGKSETPVYLWIEDGKAELKDAQPIWGKGNRDAYHWLREHHGAVRTVQIGPAGENLVKYACIVNEMHHVNGRSGLGAVMGSKKLKAIAVRGTGKPQISDPEKFTAWKNWHDKSLLESFYGKYFREHGTPSGFDYQNVMGSLPTRNFNDDTFEQIAKISTAVLEEKFIKKHSTCFGCVLRCKPIATIADDPQVDGQLGGPEYETLAAFGSLCGVGDPEAIIKANALSADLGMDSISLGSTIAFAMECGEKGLLDEKLTNGMEVKFGNAATMLQLIQDIAYRKGLGDLLAEGSRRAAEKIGKGAEQFAMQVKGQELPMHDGRIKPGLALAYAVNPAGADHNTAPMDDMYSKKGQFLSSAAPLGILEPVPETSLGADKVRLYTYLALERGITNCLLMCNFVGIPTTPVTLPKLAEVVSAVTGWELSSWELMKVSERGINLARLFNLKHGITSAEDALPDRMFTPVKAGPKVGRVLKKEEFAEAKALFYSMLGWDANGNPTRTKLIELNILDCDVTEKGG
jgi:aldehyde:ferredoxin oxidoreductase